MAATSGLDHLGLSVLDLNQTTDFFTQCLGWRETGRDESYPQTAVSDGKVRLTLWQVTEAKSSSEFDRKANIGLHHVAFKVETELELLNLSKKVQDYPGVVIEFMPELVGKGPRKHMMCSEPGGLRVEFIWNGQ